MPDHKKSNKSTGKSTASKKTTTGKRSAAASSKKNTVKKSVTKSNYSENTFLSQAAPYIFAVLAILLGVCVVIGEGTIGGGIRDILTGLFAGGAYILPILLLLRTILWNRDAEEGQLTGRSACLAIVFILITMFLHVVGGGQSTLAVKEHYADGVELIGGGVFGGVLGELCLMGFGKVCTLIILVAAIVLLALYVAGITPRMIFIYIAYKIKYAGETHQERQQEKRRLAEERRRTAKPTRNQLREEEYLAYLREKKQRERQAKRYVNPNAADVQNTENAMVMPRMDSAPMQLPNASATVYRVKKRRMADVDIPVDDITVPQEEWNENTSNAEEYGVGAAEMQEEVQNALNDTSVDRGAVDEKIFDEVMRRTRERIEKSRKAEDLRTDPSAAPAGMKSYTSARNTPSAPEMPAVKKQVEIIAPDTAHDFTDAENSTTEIAAGDVLDAVEMAAIEIREKSLSDTSLHSTAARDNAAATELSGNMSAYDADELPFALDDVADAFKEDRSQDSVTAAKPSVQHEDETDTVRLATAGEHSDEFDVTKIFVNPADAELLDKLSEQYRQPLDVQRTTISTPTQEPVKPAKPSTPPYQFPPIDILAEDPGGNNENIKEELQENAVKLVETLRSFKVSTKIENISRGPTITRYELLLDPGVRVRSVVNLVDDISLSLATTGVRIEAPIPGKTAVGIEVPNKKQTTVHLRTLLEDRRFREAKSPLTVALGEDVAGEAVYFDISKMPHLLIAGATGAGKSVCINSIITSLLYKASPEDVKLILIDPKKVELSIYNGIPHLLVPVVSEPKKAAGSLSWAVSEMERRYGLIEAVGARNIKGFNEATKNDPDYEYMPSIVIIIDELADLMMTAPDDVEDSICRIAQKARAAGMHLIIGTQRPSVDVITGLIKANVPSRIAFRTSSQIDSRTIIDVGHAANLIGMGDMLFNPVGALKPRRVQGAYVNESDVEEVVAYIKNMNTAYDNQDSEKIVNEIEREAQKCGSVSGKGKGAASEDDSSDEDPMLKSAVELAIDSGKISTSLIQRRLSLGYGRAAKLIDRMEQLGYVSAPDGSKPREVLITKSEYMEMRLKDEAPFDL